MPENKAKLNYFINYLNFVKMKKLELNQMVNVNGGASDPRCARMQKRWLKRGGDSSSRLYDRIQKNCGDRDIQW